MNCGNFKNTLDNKTNSDTNVSLKKETKIIIPNYFKKLVLATTIIGIIVIFALAAIFIFEINNKESDPRGLFIAKGVGCIFVTTIVVASSILNFVIHFIDIKFTIKDDKKQRKISLIKRLIQMIFSIICAAALSVSAWFYFNNQSVTTTNPYFIIGPIVFTLTAIIAIAVGLTANNHLIEKKNK